MSPPASPAVPGTRIRHTHPYGFRSGAWATVRAVVPGDGRECYLVQFPDGVTDFWPVTDPAEPYEFAPHCGEQRRDTTT